VEDGDHDALIRLGGRYARLFHLQAAPYTGGSINGSAPDPVVADHDRDAKRRADGTGRW
jgi:hypothetical protein